MEISYVFNFYDNLFVIIGLIISSFIAFWIYKLSRELSAREKYQHELKITKEIRKIKIYSSVILADVLKYHPLQTDTTNRTYSIFKLYLLKQYYKRFKTREFYLKTLKLCILKYNSILCIY